MRTSLTGFAFRRCCSTVCRNNIVAAIMADASEATVSTAAPLSCCAPRHKVARNAAIISSHAAFCAADATLHLSGRPLTLILRLAAGYELQGLGPWMPARARSAAVRYLPLEPRAACLPAHGRVSHTLSHPVVRCSQSPPPPRSVRAAPLASCGGSLFLCMGGGAAMLGSARRGASRPQEWLPSWVASYYIPF